VDFSAEVARLRAHVAIKGSRALKSRVKQAQPFSAVSIRGK
jgi:hypothetical protein